MLHNGPMKPSASTSSLVGRFHRMLLAIHRILPTGVLLLRSLRVPAISSPSLRNSRSSSIPHFAVTGQEESGAVALALPRLPLVKILCEIAPRLLLTRTGPSTRSKCTKTTATPNPLLPVRQFPLTPASQCLLLCHQILPSIRRPLL